MFLLASCSGLGVQPWERDLHAEPEMAMDADSLDLALDEHIYFSRDRVFIVICCKIDSQVFITWKI